MKHLLSLFVISAAAFALLPSACICREAFDTDPGWDGRNNRIAKQLQPRTTTQDFGYSSTTSYAGGQTGEIGGLIQPADKPSYYATNIKTKTLKDRLNASGKLWLEKGDSNILFGFFNDKTINEWRTPNALVIRINGRGEIFHAHSELTTNKWRATAGIIGSYNPVTDRNTATELPCRTTHDWSLEYDPSGSGTFTLTVAGHKSSVVVDPDLRKDGATFNRFGILNVVKSHDSAGKIWLDDISINGDAQDFSRDPRWKGLRNRTTHPTRGVRPWFDFGYSPTNYAGGAAPGEIGGIVYRGDCRYPERMACYGARIGKLTLDQPLHASGKIALRRGVTDSTVAFGFYNSVSSMQVSDSQQFSTPRDFLGVFVEGPSRKGFLVYPVCRNQGDEGVSNHPANSPHLLPDGKSHRWTLDYDPAGNGRLRVTLDGQASVTELPEGIKAGGATFDRFGFVTTWVDGNAQEIYLDDLDFTKK